MEQHEKNEDIPKRLRLMKKRLKQVLVLLGILIITLALSGCENFVESDVSAETRLQTTVSETTSKEILKREQVEPIGNDSYGSPAYPLPDDWTFEKIANIISIDGYQISIPCSLNDILSLSDDFNINGEMKQSEDKKMAYLFYKDIEIGSISYDERKVVSYISLYGYSESDFIYIDNIEIHDTEKITELMQTLIKQNNTDYFYGKFIDEKENKKIGVSYYTKLGNIIIWIV